MDMDRIFTEEELKEMGTQTMEAAIAAVEAGDGADRYRSSGFSEGPGKRSQETLLALRGQTKK